MIQVPAAGAGTLVETTGKRVKSERRACLSPVGRHGLRIKGENLSIVGSGAFAELGTRRACHGLLKGTREDRLVCSIDKRCFVIKVKQPHWQQISVTCLSG